MKKLLLFLLLAIPVLNSYSQDTIKKTKTYKNELGIDASVFIKNYLSISQTIYTAPYTDPAYYLTYRRHLKKSNIRFAIGGSFSSADVTPSSTAYNRKYHNDSYQIDARIGWEYCNTLSKRWQVYYGVDFRPSYSYVKDDAQNWNGGYANGVESKSSIYGIAPLLGFRFKLTDRLSLTTEACFSVNRSLVSARYYFIPTSGLYPPMPDDIHPPAKKIYSSFSQPVSVVIAFDI